MRLLDLALLKFAADSPFMIRPLDSAQMGTFGGVAGGALGAGLGALGGAGLGAVFGSAGNRKRNAIKGALMGLIGGGALGATGGYNLASGAADAAHNKYLNPMVESDLSANGVKFTERPYIRDLFQKAKNYGPTAGHALNDEQGAALVHDTPGWLWGGDIASSGARQVLGARKSQFSQAINRHVQFPLKDLSKVLNNQEAFLNPQLSLAFADGSRDASATWPTKRMAQSLADQYSKREDSH